MGQAMFGMALANMAAQGQLAQAQQPAKKPPPQGGDAAKTGTCFIFEQTGRCKFGDTCRYLHVAKTKKRMVGAKKKEEEEEEDEKEELEIDAIGLKNEKHGAGAMIYDEEEVIGALGEETKNDAGQTLVRWRIMYCPPCGFELWKKIMLKVAPESLGPNGKPLGVPGSMKKTKAILADLDDHTPAQLQCKRSAKREAEIKQDEKFDKLCGVVTTLAENIQKVNEKVDTGSAAKTPRGQGTSSGYRTSPATPVERKARKQPCRRVEQRPPRRKQSGRKKEAVSSKDLFESSEEDELAVEEESEPEEEEGSDDLSDIELSEPDSPGTIFKPDPTRPMPAFPAVVPPGVPAAAKSKAKGPAKQEVMQWLEKYKDFVGERLAEFKMAPGSKQKPLPAGDSIGPECHFMIAHNPVQNESEVRTFKDKQMDELGLQFRKVDYQAAVEEGVDKLLDTMKNLQGPCDWLDAILLSYGIRFAGTKKFKRTVMFATLCICRNEREKKSRGGQ